MTLNTFKDSLQKTAPNASWSNVLKALWYEGKGNWSKAHDIVDSGYSSEEAWVHAYLHRKEGDQWNANYWYRRAGKRMPNTSLEAEWEALVCYFLD